MDKELNAELRNKLRATMTALKQFEYNYNRHHVPEEIIEPALKELNEVVIDIEPENTIVFKLLGDVYYIKSDYDKAIEAYLEYINNKPKDHHVYNCLGVAYSEKGDYDKAIEAYKKSLEIIDEDYVVYSNLAGAYESKRDYDKAIEAYQKAIKLGTYSPRTYWPRVPVLYAMLGNMYIAKGHNEAKRIVKKLRQMGANSDAARLEDAIKP